MTGDEANEETQERDLVRSDAGPHQPVRDAGTDGAEEMQIEPLLDLVALRRERIGARTR